MDFQCAYKFLSLACTHEYVKIHRSDDIRSAEYEV